MYSKLSHLKKEEIDQLIQRYYNGEKINALIAEFKIDTKTSTLNKLFPPKICEDIYCPYCENENMVLMHESRNPSSIKPVPQCPVCNHVNQACNCNNCQQARYKQQLMIIDKKRALIVAKCKSLQMEPCPFEELPFETAVYLMALTRHSVSEDFMFVSLFKNIPLKLAPTPELTMQILAYLRESGIVNISEESSIEGFYYNEDISQFNGYNATRVQWKFLPVFSMQEKKQYINGLEKMIASRNWPDHWMEESNKCWHNIALHECIEYVTHLLKDRDFDIEEVGDKTCAALESLLSKFSVAQIFNLSWQSIKDTVDFLIRQHIPRSTVTNMFASVLLRKADRCLAQGWIVNDSKRDFNCAQSAVSATFSNLFLGLGDSAFSTRIPKL